MKAIVFRRYGSPDNLELRELPKPVPKGNEVLVAVRAVSINDWDLGLLEGTPFVNRLMSGLRTPSWSCCARSARITSWITNAKTLRRADTRCVRV